MVSYTGTSHPEPLWSTKTETPMRDQIVRFSTEDRGNVSKDDIARLLEAGFIPVFVKNLPTVVPNPENRPMAVPLV